MNKLHVLFKTKGGVREGIGDVTSSLAIADDFMNYGQVLFIVNNDKRSLDLIRRNGFEFIIAESRMKIARILASTASDITVLNQLNTTVAEATIFKRHSKMLVTIEDAGKAAELADLRFNILYPKPGAITDLRYMPLAASFQAKHQIPKIIKKKVRHILVLQGGSDTHGFTPKIVRSLENIPKDVKISVVLGPNFTHEDELSRVLDKKTRPFKIIRGSLDLSNLMSEADMAVSAGGNTLFELASLGIPAIVVCGESFEVKTAKRLEEEGFGINLGFGSETSVIRRAVNGMICNFGMRRQMSVRGRELIDGKGVTRLVREILRFKRERR